MPRRWFLAQGLLLSGVGAGLAWLLEDRESPYAAESCGLPLRPPTARSNDAEFRSLCVRCGLCGTVCENGCIRFFSLDEPEHGAHTPYLDVRRRSCTLCMRCTNICPTGALSPTPDEEEAIVARVHIGKAVVDVEYCISHLGRLCGYCHDACPLPGRAIRLAPPALPVILDGCVGCGRCVEECPQQPTAIRVERLEVAT